MQSIRWGILGTADIARKALIPAFREASNGEVAAIASRSLDRARAFAREMDVPKAYGDYDSLLNDPDIDAVYIPLPITMHAEWCVRAAEAGKPVLCEKPFAESAEAAARVVRVFEDRKLPLAEALMYRFHPMTQRVLQLIREGAVGVPTMVHSQFNADAKAADNIRMQRSLGGGAMLDLGCYCVSVLRLLTGEEPESVSAHICLGPEKVDLSTVGLLTFPSGVVGHFGCGLRSQFDCSYGITGTEGRLLVDWGAMCAWPGEDFTIKHWHPGGYDEIVVPQANHYRLLAEDFAGAVLENRPPAFDMSDTVANLRVIDEVFRQAVVHSVGY